MIHTPITWIVQHGKKRWKQLWFPTANILYTWDLEDGVYKMNIVYDNKVYPGMWTYFAERELLEAHLFDVTLDLYDKEITIYPLFKTRNNQSFDSPEELISTIQQDQRTITNMPWTVLTFGTFDYLHPWHMDYLTQASCYGDRLVTIVALDETVQKIKWAAPDHSAQNRLQAITDLKIPHHTVVLWDAHNVYQCLHDWSPQVIYLWYDQHSFDEGIQAYCSDAWLSVPHIVRGNSFQPEVYKSSLIRSSR